MILRVLSFVLNRDVGIDFFYCSDRTFEVFQCKMHEPHPNGQPELATSFGPEGFSDLQRACEFLFGNYPGEC